MELEPPTLEELVEMARIPLTRLDEECSDEHLLKISLFLDRRVAPYLGLSALQIEAIDSDKKKESEKRLQTLKRWKEKYAYKATYKKLVEALLVIEDASSAQKVCQLLQPQVHEGGSSDSEAVISSKQPQSSSLATTKLSSTATTPSDKPPGSTLTITEPNKQPEAPSTTVEGAKITTESLKQKIDKEIGELEDQFFNVVRKASSDLEKIALSEVKLCVIQLPTSVKHENIKFLQENILAINNAKSVSEIFSILALYWDFLNCGLLKEIVRRLGESETKQLMEKYSVKLKEFRMKTKLEDFIGKWVRNCPPHFSEFVSTMDGDWREHTLEDLDIFRIDLAGKMFLEDYAMRCTKITTGSVSVTWALPSSLPEIADTLQSIFPLLEEEYDVLMVVFQGKHIPELAPLENPSDSGVEMAQDVRVTEKDREKRRQRMPALHQRRERELLQELQKQEPKPKQRRPRYKKKLHVSQEPQGSVATTQDKLRYQPCGDLLFDTKLAHFLASLDSMFIASVGSEYPASVMVEHKPSDRIRAQRALNKTHVHDRFSHRLTSLPEGTEVDLIIFSSHIRHHPRLELVSLNLDLPGTERSRDYYLQEMKKLMKECGKLGAFIWYTGHSEEGTGNWCFKDGTISFQEIFDLYRAHFSGRLLHIVSDCCYSGKWVHTCAEILDNMGIPPCGHKAREQGVMIKIYASCQPDQRAGDPCFSLEESEFGEENQRMYSLNKQLTESQTTLRGDFTRLVCCKGPDDACPAESAFKNWKWADAVSGKMWRNIYFIRGEIRGRRAWHSILLSSADEGHIAQFLAETGPINVADWGHVIASGWGEDPPQDIKDKIETWTWVSRR